MLQPAQMKAAYLSVCGEKEPDCKYNEDKKKGMMEIMNSSTLSEIWDFHCWTPNNWCRNHYYLSETK